MIKRKTVYRILFHALYLYAIYILQAGVFSWIPAFGMYPLLLPVAAAGIAMFEGSTVGGICGLFAGMLCDVAFNSPTMLYTITLTAVGLGVAYLAEKVLAQSFISYLAANAAALLFVSLIQGFSVVFFAGQAFMPVLSEAILQTVYSLVFSILLYFPARALSRSGANDCV